MPKSSVTIPIARYCLLYRQRGSRGAIRRDDPRLTAESIWQRGSRGVICHVDPRLTDARSDWVASTFRPQSHQGSAAAPSNLGDRIGDRLLYNSHALSNPLCGLQRGAPRLSAKFCDTRRRSGLRMKRGEVFDLFTWLAVAG